MKKVTIFQAIRYVSASVILTSTFYLLIGFETGLWHPYWVLYAFPVIIWLALDLYYNVTNNTMFYRGLIPLIVIIYIVYSVLSGDWINGLIIISVIPFLVLVYNARFYGYKYLIIPIVFSVLAVIYLYLGLFFQMWHPSWVIFLIGAATPLLIKY